MQVYAMRRFPFLAGTFPGFFFFFFPCGFLAFSKFSRYIRSAFGNPLPSVIWPSLRPPSITSRFLLMTPVAGPKCSLSFTDIHLTVQRNVFSAFVRKIALSFFREVSHCMEFSLSRLESLKSLFNLLPSFPHHVFHRPSVTLPYPFQHFREPPHPVCGRHPGMKKGPFPP